MKRWTYLVIGALMLLFLGLIYAWSIFKAPFSAIYTDWSVSQISLTFTISMIFFCLGGFFSGNLIKKLQPRIVLWIAAAMLFVGFFGVSKLDPENSAASLRLLYVLYGVLCGGGVGMCYNAIISTVNKWFADKTGLASGVMMMGFGFGGLILGSATSRMIAASGLFHTFMILAIVIAVVVVIGSFFMNPPAAMPASATKKETEKKSGKEGNADVQTTARDYSAVEMLKTPAFWIFVIWVTCLNAAGLLVINSAVPIATAFGAPVVIGLIVSLFNGGGRVVLGSIFDRFGRKITVFINTAVMLLAGLCLTFGAMSSGIVLLAAGLMLTGLAYGGDPSISSAFINGEYGPKNFPVNFSICNFSLIPAAIIGPMISSALIEKAGGAYNTTFVMMIVLAAAAFVCWLLLNRFSAAAKK